jgi:hypothetical protein
VSVTTHTREAVPFAIYPAKVGSGRAFTEADAAAVEINDALAEQRSRVDREGVARLIDPKIAPLTGKKEGCACANCKAWTIALAKADAILTSLGFTSPPVAWRVKDMADGWIYYTDERQAANQAEETGARIEALVPVAYG